MDSGIGWQMNGKRSGNRLGEIAHHPPIGEREVLLSQWASNQVLMQDIDNAPRPIDQVVNKIVEATRGHKHDLSMEEIRGLIDPALLEKDFEEMQKRWAEKDRLMKKNEEIGREIIAIGAKTLPDKLASASAAIGAITIAGMTGLFYLSTVGQTGIPGYAKFALLWGAIGTLMAAVPRLPPLFAATMDWLWMGKNPPSRFGLRRWIVWIELACLGGQMAMLAIVAAGVLSALR